MDIDKSFWCVIYCDRYAPCLCAVLTFVTSTNAFHYVDSPTAMLIVCTFVHILGIIRIWQNQLVLSMSSFRDPAQ